MPLDPLSCIYLRNAALIDMQLSGNVMLILTSSKPPAYLSNQFRCELCPFRSPWATRRTIRHMRTFLVRQLDDGSRAKVLPL